MALSELVLVLFLVVARRSAPPVGIAEVLGVTRPGWVSPQLPKHERRQQADQPHRTTCGSGGPADVGLVMIRPELARAKAARRR